MTTKSNLKLETFKHPLDRFWQLTLIKITPRIVTPNLISLLRIALIPVLLGLMYWESYFTGLLLFIFIALTDSFDGALARYRQQITDLGLILDPLADKLLIIATLIFFISHYPFPELIFYLMVFELIVLLLGYIKISIFKQTAWPSNLWGKIKMVCQSLAVLAIFGWLIIPTTFLLYLSAYLLLAALLFLILSALVSRKS